MKTNENDNLSMEEWKVRKDNLVEFYPSGIKYFLKHDSTLSASIQIYGKGNQLPIAKS